MPKLVLLRKTSLSYDIEELSKTKTRKQEKSESNLLFNRLCKNLWMIFANVIYGPILSFVPRINYISISQINVEFQVRFQFQRKNDSETDFKS